MKNITTIMKNIFTLVSIMTVYANTFGQAPIDATIVVIPEAEGIVQSQEPTVVKSNAITEYKAQVISTNFTIPIIRFNPIDKQTMGAPQDKKGNVSFFNSIGAGIGYYWGRLSEVTDGSGKVLNTEMNNTFGIQTGFLFAANSSGSNNTNIFALTFGVSLLNFQLGYGYEFGTLGTNEKRGFFTLAYGIPVSKLVNGGFYVRKKSRALSDSYFAK